MGLIGMSKPKLTFAIAALLVVIAVVVVAVWLVPRDFEALPVARKVEIAVARQLEPDASGPRDGLSESHSPLVDTYEFKCDSSYNATILRLSSFEVPGYKLTKDWDAGSSGYKNVRTYTDSRTGATVNLGVTWVPAEKHCKVALVWRKN